MNNVLLLALILLTPPLWAHPHVWIDMEVTPQTDTVGNITALHERWLFDPFYAQMLIEPISQAHDTAEQKQLWQHLQDDIRSNLNQKHYYTFPKTLFADAQDGKLVNADGALYIDVTVPLRKPTKTLRYQIYEPEYFVEMLHSEQQRKHFANGCTLKIIAPEPGADKYAQAAALDRNEKGEDNLGHYFAETGVITCP